ncbi:MAG: hypothetical protein EXR11_00425 [Rhodospirillaceae bacterium]|nr:hypothetical protein [Rhodospirillaceae bacterium]
MIKNWRIPAYGIILAIALYYYFVPRQAARPPQPEVVAAPTPAPAAEIAIPDNVNLGIRRDQLQSVFERAPYKLTFEFKPLADGRSRMIGQTMDGMTKIDLIGPPEGLAAAVVTANMPDNNKLAQVKNLNALMNAAKLALPDWTEGEVWVNANIPAAFQSGSASTTIDGRTLTMSVTPNTKILVMTIIGRNPN